MKKTALTFGLFSLVMVATSFATPKTNSVLLAQNQTIERDGETDGTGAVGGQKKADFHQVREQLMDTDGTGATGGQKKADFHQVRSNSHLNFASVNQSIGTDKKLD